MSGSMRGIAWLSVRAKLAIGFLFVGIVPLVVFALLEFNSVDGALEQQAASAMTNRRQALGAALDSRSQAILDQVVSYGEWGDEFCAAMDRRDVQWLGDNATTWVVDNSAMTGAQALTLQGKALSSAGDLKGVDLSASPVIAAARRGGNSTELCVIGNRFVLLGAGPIMESEGEGSPKHGVIVFARAVDQPLLANLAAIIGAGQLDLYEDGKLLASSAGGSAKPLPPDVTAGEAVRDGADALLLTELPGAPSDSTAQVVLRVDSDAVAVTGRALAWAASYAMLMAIAFALLGALLVARALSRPLQLLSTGAKAIAAGDLEQHVDITTDDAFGEVASAFNLMSAELTAAFSALRRRSETDGLTGLLNHRAMYEAVAGEIVRCRRYACSLSLLILDVDGFKPLNDAYGHLAGDEVLRRLAELLRSGTRAADSAGRVGGDEFMVLLPETAADEATRVAEKLRVAVACRPYVGSDGRQIPIRVSIGVASFPADAAEATDLIAHADAGLYMSKQRGGDAVTHDLQPACYEERQSCAPNTGESRTAAVLIGEARSGGMSGR